MKCGSGIWDKNKIVGVEKAGVGRMERQSEIILRKPKVTLLDWSFF